MADPLSRPLVFGDKEQIEALKNAEAAAEFKKLPNCEGCKGSGHCGSCEADCGRCSGIGKPWQVWEKFQKLYPSYLP